MSENIESIAMAAIEALKTINVVRADETSEDIERNEKAISDYWKAATPEFVLALCEALKPFADEAEKWNDWQKPTSDSFVPSSVQYTVGDLRRAARMLNTLGTLGKTAEQIKAEKP